MHSIFYIDLKDRSNIRFDSAREPTGALGNLGWYCLRAVVEYLQPQGAISQACAFGRHDPETGAITQVTGLLAFESGESATFGAGFQSGTMVDDLSLFGDKGVIKVNDFVMNWTNSFGRQAPDVPTGYIHRHGSMTRNDFIFVETPSQTPQQVLMIQNFADLAVSGDRRACDGYAAAAWTTQHYLDTISAKVAAP